VERHDASDHHLPALARIRGDASLHRLRHLFQHDQERRKQVDGESNRGAGRIVQTANAITDRNEFDAFVKAVEPAMEKMKPGMKKAVEASIATKQAELFA
jgi:hypothetical protein